MTSDQRQTLYLGTYVVVVGIVLAILYNMATTIGR